MMLLTCPLTLTSYSTWERAEAMQQTICRSNLAEFATCKARGVLSAQSARPGLSFAVAANESLAALCSDQGKLREAARQGKLEDWPAGFKCYCKGNIAEGRATSLYRSDKQPGVPLVFGGCLPSWSKPFDHCFIQVWGLVALMKAQRCVR